MSVMIIQGAAERLAKIHYEIDTEEKPLGVGGMGQVFKGIRVDEKSLDEQLTKAGCDERRKLPFHKMLLEGKLPLTIGGGIGQSRICMLLLKKAHIGEVQASIWDEDTVQACEKAGIELL